MDAFRERGTAAATLTPNGGNEAKRVLAEAERLGLEPHRRHRHAWLVEGVASFAKAFDDLLGSIAAKQPAAA